MVAVNNIKISIFKTESKIMGLITELKPKTQRKLKIFDPTTPPTAILAFPLLAANTEADNSGKEVPTATMVKPTKD